MSTRLLLFSFFLLSPLGVFGYSSPGSPTGFVNDFAGVLSSEVRASLEEKLVVFAKETSTEIAVVTVPTIGDDYIENYSIKLAEEWGVGGKKKDNGIIVLLAIEDRKLRIEVGYGLEGALPDSVADRIIRDEMVPHLKSGAYDVAVQNAVEKIIAATRGEYTAEGSSKGGWQDALFFLLFFGIIAFEWLASVLGRTKDWWLGGVLGFGAGSGFAILATLFGFMSLSLVAFGVIIVALTGLGFFFDYVVSSTYTHARRYGYDAPWWVGGGSGSSGGFGGFGGGGFGGGGSSGSW